VRTKELDRVVEIERGYRQLIEVEAAPARARAALRNAVLDYARVRVPDDIAVEPVDQPSVRGEWVSTPFDSEGRRIVFVHGSAFAFGSAAESRELAGRIARSSQTRVLALEYRLAPEHPLPAAIDDVVAAIRWLMANEITAPEIALVGQSTGAGVALAATIALRDAGEPTPGALALLSPVVDLTRRSPESIEDPVQAWDLIERQADGYLAGVRRDDHRASPLLANLTGMPPMLIQLGTTDPVLHQGRELAAKAQAAGVTVSCTEREGMVHGWQRHPHVLEAVRASNEVGEYLLQRIGPAYVPVSGGA
jgi:epsilon-lactone hydrolase